MSNKIKEIYNIVKSAERQRTIFSSAALKDIPDLAKGYLFQVEFIDPVFNTEFADLTLKTRKVDFHEADDGFDITFDEFEDFRVWQQLNQFLRTNDHLTINIKFYDSKLERVLYTHTKEECVCTKILPLNLDVSNNKKLEIKAVFR